MNESEEIIEMCYPPPSLDRRWYLVAVAGTSLSFLSIITNIVIAKVLLSSRHNQFFFLAVIAINDCLLSFNYGPVIAMEIIKDRLGEKWLHELYLSYVGPLLALCQTSMTFSCYLIILATLERYLITLRSKCLPTFRRCRGLLALLMFILSFLLRAPIYYEMHVITNPLCIGEYMEKGVDLLPIVNSFWYGNFYRFYVRNIMTVLVPFCVLALLNYKIVKILRTQQRSAQMFRFLSSDHKSKIRSATLMMVFVVCSYLVANILNVVVTLWEYVAFHTTQEEGYFEVYEFFTDVTSVLYIFVCATRLFVYYLCNQEIRDDIKHLICNVTTTPRKQDYVTVTRSLQSTPIVVLSALLGPRDVVGLSSQNDSSRQIGTEIDAVAIAIARRLHSNDIMTNSKPITTDSYVISNHHADVEDYDEDIDDDDEDQIPHMV
ncbi:unnamed protein product [Caenorhabditis angaria]|uniref:G-protein coupled receptors family 1 profile domain-containing protein n=1 Tax=Caenorhabditis angaria TaxID=860376 RepID=A0A9P1IG29_9PELO|nr:unnamed protein product [Caenorhabditis angaria]